MLQINFELVNGAETVVCCSIGLLFDSGFYRSHFTISILEIVFEGSLKLEMSQGCKRVGKLIIVVTGSCFEVDKKRLHPFGLGL